MCLVISLANHKRPRVLNVGPDTHGYVDTSSNTLKRMVHLRQLCRPAERCIALDLQPTEDTRKVGLRLVGGRNDSDVSPSKKIILCIDDDDSILRFERALLERSGYAVLIAASAQEGLKLATTCMCDAVLLDYQMPGMNGHKVASQIRLGDRAWRSFCSREAKCLHRR